MLMPIPALAALLIGGGFAAGEASDALKAKRQREMQEQVPRISWETVNAIRAATLGQPMPMTESQLEQGAAPALMQTLLQTTPEMPEVPITEVPPVGAQPQPQQKQPSQGQTGQTGQPGETTEPMLLPEPNISSEGKVSWSLKSNERYWKIEQQKNFLQDIDRFQQENLAAGKSRAISRRDALKRSGILHGMPIPFSEFKEIYPDMSKEERYNHSRNMMQGMLADGLDFERAQNIATRYYPDTSREEWQKIATDVYYIRQGAMFDYIKQALESQGMSPEEAEAEAGKIAAQQSAEGLTPYLPEAEREKLRAIAESKVTRIGEIPTDPVQRAILDRYGASAIVRQGAIGGIEEQVAQRQMGREVETAKQTTMARERGKLATQMEQIEPNVASLAQMSLALNTAEGLGELITDKAKLLIASKIQYWPGEVMVGGKMVRLGTLAADYKSAVNQFLGTMARVFGGERGVLTYQDIERIRDAVPRLGDMKDLTERKIGRLLGIIAEIKGRAGIPEGETRVTDIDAALKKFQLQDSELINVTRSKGLIETIDDAF